MMQDRVKAASQAASRNLSLKLVSMGFNLFRENPFFGCVKCSVQLSLIESAITKLLLIIPSTRNDQGQQIAATWIAPSKQIAEAVFVPGEEINSQNTCGLLRGERPF